MSNLFPTTVIYCDKFEVRDVKAVKAILQRFNTSHKFVLVPGRGRSGQKLMTLKIEYDDDLGPSNWPSAIEKDLIDQHGDPVDSGGDDPEEVLEEYSREGFLRLLIALAPFLLTPLTIQAIRNFQNESRPMHACEWHINPGATSVEVNEFQHWL